MNLSTKAAAGAVVASSVLSGGLAEKAISVSLGLAGVALARQVFLSKEKRRTGMKQPMSESLPLTLCAMLVTGVVIWDRELGLSMSVFTGLGVGWTAILLLDVLGGWVLKTGKRIFQVTDEDMGISPEERALLNNLDEKEGS